MSPQEGGDIIKLSSTTVLWLLVMSKNSDFHSLLLGLVYEVCTDVQYCYPIHLHAVACLFESYVLHFKATNYVSPPPPPQGALVFSRVPEAGGGAVARSVRSLKG